MPELYTFAPVDFELPDGVPSQVLFTVYFTEMESVVTEEAFRLAGLQDTYPYSRGDEPNQHST